MRRERWDLKAKGGKEAGGEERKQEAEYERLECDGGR